MASKAKHGDHHDHPIQSETVAPDAGVVPWQLIERDQNGRFVPGPVVQHNPNLTIRGCIEWAATYQKAALGSHDDVFCDSVSEAVDYFLLRALEIEPTTADEWRCQRAIIAWMTTDPQEESGFNGEIARRFHPGFNFEKILTPLAS